STPMRSPAEIGRLAHDAALDAAWRQWTALGAAGGTAANEPTTLDPEALVLASSVLVEHERRLGDFLLWWADAGTRLLSVQRMRSLLKTWPDEASQNLGGFARAAVEAGDRRWKRLAEGECLEARLGKGALEPRLTEPTALVLRLRAGFGVSAKADLLAILLGLERPASVRMLADAIGYSTVAVRVALGEVVLAGFVEMNDETPATYRVRDGEAWSALMGEPPSRWGYWAERYAVLLDIAAWGCNAGVAEWSPYVAASKARDVWERHRRAFRLLTPDAPRLDRIRNEEVLPALQDAVEALASS
ncbi:MAG: hypothetical protein AAFX41_00240, partial [Bacteroidota bacterium]